MGRKGDALRAAKKQKTVYHLTGEQLEQHDKAVIEAYKRDLDGRMKDAADKYVREYFERIGAEFTTGNERDDVDLVVTYLLSVTVRVLIERFGWKPIRYNCRPTKTQRFIEDVIAVIEDIRADDTKDIRDYADEVERLYGVRVVMKEE